VEKHATALALFPADNTGSLEVGLFLQNDEYRTRVMERLKKVYIKRQRRGHFRWGGLGNGLLR